MILYCSRAVCAAVVLLFASYRRVAGAYNLPHAILIRLPVFYRVDASLLIFTLLAVCDDCGWLALEPLLGMVRFLFFIFVVTVWSIGRLAYVIQSNPIKSNPIQSNPVTRVRGYNIRTFQKKMNNERRIQKSLAKAENYNSKDRI